MELFILPFDHRSSLLKKLYTTANPNAKQREEFVLLKKMVYAGFEKAIALGIDKKKAAILVDDEFGSEILRDAKAKSYVFCLAVEKSGMREFEFEHRDFEKHVEKFNPTFVKALVHFNPENDNKRQIAKLKRLHDFCRRSRRKYILELLVPPTQAQLKQFSREKFESLVRPKLTVTAMAQLQKAGAKPDIWKLEGVDKKAQALALARQAQGAGIIVLGRGESEAKVRRWLKTSAKIKGVIGFAVGRTVFWNAMKAMHSEKMNAGKASDAVARNYKKFVDLWREERGVK